MGNTVEVRYTGGSSCVVEGHGVVGPGATFTCSAEVADGLCAPGRPFERVDLGRDKVKRKVAE